MRVVETTLGAVLTHTTGVVLADLDEVWSLQDAVLGQHLLTYERIHSKYDISTVLFNNFPVLEFIMPPEISNEDECNEWLISVADHTNLELNLKVQVPDE